MGIISWSVKKAKYEKRSAALPTRGYLQRDWRFWAVAATLALLAVAGGVIIASLPPRTIVMATGPEGSADYELGARYREILARSGVVVRLVATAGSLENLKLLRDPNSRVSAGFLQGGLTNKEESPSIESLGTIGYEPLWLFYRSNIGGANLETLAGRRLSIGPDGSGGRALALEIAAKTGIATIVGELSGFGPEVAADKLKAGDIDAAFIVTAWDSPVIQKLANAEDIKLASFVRADALAALYPFLNKLILPAGIFDFLTNRPPTDVILLAPKASLVVRADLHSALKYLLLAAATKIHSQPGIFQKAGQFPAPESIDLPLSDDATLFYKSGRPFLQQHLPFWLATLVERMIIVLIPMAAVIYPLLKFLPTVYDSFMRSKIQRLYAEMRSIESTMNEPALDPNLDLMSQKLDQLEQRASGMRLPPAYAALLYTLRSHIGLIRGRLTAGRAKDQSRSMA